MRQRSLTKWDRQVVMCHESSSCSGGMTRRDTVETTGCTCAPCIVVRCRQLVDPDHGLIRCDSGTLYGSRCELHCRPGFAVVGQPSSVCLEHGLWSHDSPLCAGLVASIHSFRHQFHPPKCYALLRRPRLAVSVR